MARNSIAKVQHYVPQFLLRNFGIGKKDQIHVFDKQTGRIFRTSVRNVAAESRFYDFEVEGERLTVEPSLSEIETKSSKIVKKLVAAENLQILTEEDRLLIASFLAIQMTRTRAFREMLRSIHAGLAEHLRMLARDDADRDQIEEYIGSGPDDHEATLEAVRMMQSAPKDFAPHFLTKLWVLLKTDGRNPFFIGDNPLGMQNISGLGSYGNIGLAVKGIEIYFPLTPRLALALFCPSLAEGIRKRIAHLRYLSRTDPFLVAKHVSDPLLLEQIVAALDAGRPLHYQPENVTNFNSIQIRFSERYVFSAKDDFRLVQEILKKSPDVRKGPRATVGW